MYLRELLLLNVGPLEKVDLSLQFFPNGHPKPVVIVGQNGSGKTILLSYIADALVEFAKLAFQDVVPSQGINTPYFKLVGPTNQKSGAPYGVGLLSFQAAESPVLNYSDKSGNVLLDALKPQLRNRFSDVLAWPQEGNHKQVTGASTEAIQKEFLGKVHAFFPSSRKEYPHWLNLGSLRREDEFDLSQNFGGNLRKPVFVEASSAANRSWLLDVFLDSMVDVFPGPNGQLQAAGNLADKLLLRRGRSNIESLLKTIFRDGNVELRLNYRAARNSRLTVVRGQTVVAPGLEHLSSGQAILFNLFCSIIRYADIGSVIQSINLDQVEGIVVIDEIDAHLHSDLQYDVLPRLLKLFPKVQFIVTSHSPLFLLGMDREFGAKNYSLIEMPSGQTLESERFSEFLASFNYYKETKAFEDNLHARIAAGTKPIVLTEGETDPEYLRRALQVHGARDIQEHIDIEWIGYKKSGQAVNTGINALNNFRNFVEANPNYTQRRTMLLYDADAKKPAEDVGTLRIRSLPFNPSNTKVKKGIENLFDVTLFEDRFYPERKKLTDYGELTTVQSFDKTAFCQWVCNERNNAGDFDRFKSIVDEIRRFAESQA